MDINVHKMLNSDILTTFSYTSYLILSPGTLFPLLPAKQCHLFKNVVIVWAKIIDFSTYA